MVKKKTRKTGHMKNCYRYPKLWRKKRWFYGTVVCKRCRQNGKQDQTAPSRAVWSGCTLFAKTCLSTNLRSLRYVHMMVFAQSDQRLCCSLLRLEAAKTGFLVTWLKSSLIWVYTVCQDLSVHKLKIITLCSHDGIYPKYWNSWNEPHHEKTCFAICEEQRHRSACAFVQSDQCLYCSLLRQDSFYIQNFKPLHTRETVNLYAAGVL